MDVPEEDVPTAGGGPETLALVRGHAQDVLPVEGLPVVGQEHRPGLVDPARMARGRGARAQPSRSTGGNSRPLGSQELTQKTPSGVREGLKLCSSDLTY